MPHQQREGGTIQKGFCEVTTGLPKKVNYCEKPYQVDKPMQAFPVMSQAPLHTPR